MRYQRSNMMAKPGTVLFLALVMVVVQSAGLHLHFYAHAPGDSHAFAESAHRHADHRHSSLLAAESLGDGHYVHQDAGIDVTQPVLPKRPFDLPKPVAAFVVASNSTVEPSDPTGIRIEADPEHIWPPTLRHELPPPLRAPPI